MLSRAYYAYAGKPLPFAEEVAAPITSTQKFTIDDALEGLFLERQEIEQILLLWNTKKNIILQGPPGVGKSFAARRLAYALLGAEDRERLGFAQFHQSYSYEDFVEGYRPTETGFELRAGKFVEFCRRAEMRTVALGVEDGDRGAERSRADRKELKRRSIKRPPTSKGQHLRSSFRR